jgi:Trm5-related predicted tRNA methylase
MLKEIKKLSEKFENVENVKKELKKVQSQKCRLAKMKAKETYEQEMTEVVAYEQALKEVRRYLEPKKLTVTTMTQEQISELNFDETVKAIKSIQSKKCNTQYLTANIEDNVEYQEALKIEGWLKEHRETIRPVEETVVKKSEIDNMMEHISTLDGNLDASYVMEMLKKLKES